jgi:parallel beta-helix repeat protein
MPTLRRAVVALTLSLALSLPWAALPARADGTAQILGPATKASGPGRAGSLAVGKASYAVPKKAIFVSPKGSDKNPGTRAKPVKTIQRGVKLAPVGGTVVVRKGVYRETVTLSKKVTLQNYPKEAVWLDGSKKVTGWVADGKVWRKNGWKTRFDSSPTFTKGAPDNTSSGWRFVNTKNPMAAHPDQVFVDGKPLKQVKSKKLVKKGTFYLDQKTSKLYIGTNPKGKTVEASTRVKALKVQAAKSVVRGIGVRRFSPSIFHMGAVTVERPGVKLENVTVTDSATIGISVLREKVTLNRVTVQRAGLLGIHGRFADGIVLKRVLATKNNSERFNIAPSAGGLKIGQTRGVTVSESRFSGNYGHGFWLDLSVYDSVLRQSDFSENSGSGLFLEISAKAIVGDNTFAKNKAFGIKVNNTSDVKIWNNTFVGNKRPVNLVQDARRNTDKNDPAVDQRQPWPNRDMPWTLGPVQVRNNVIADPDPSAVCLLCVEDYSWSKSAEQMRITANNNVYGGKSAKKARWAVVWSRANVNTDPRVFTTLKAFTKKTKQETKGLDRMGTAVLDKKLELVKAVKTKSAKTAQPLPAEIASAIGRPAGSKVLGHY